MKLVISVLLALFHISLCQDDTEAAIAEGDFVDDGGVSYSLRFTGTKAVTERKGSGFNRY